jgi:cyclopropane-fatty-acyl-phospholipid synthase
MTSKEIIEKMLESADIKIGGSRAWDIQVHDERFYDRVLSNGRLGVGESYMDGWWDCDRLDEMVFRIIQSRAVDKIPHTFTNILHVLKVNILNLQTKTRSKRVAEEHYDLGNDLFHHMLDEYMQYSCGYFKDTNDLNTAQKQKLDLICKKLQLKPTDRVLDIGCGWGGLSKWMAEKYGCHVTGVNISEEQIKFARESTKGLPVEIINTDYRDIQGTFDKIVSVGMFEHVGYKNYKVYMQMVKKLLKPDGLFLLHTIGGNKTLGETDPWIEKYIFPNSMLPSVAQISVASEDLFILEDWHNFGPYYDKTLMAWYHNFETSWKQFQGAYSERFHRMFRYYLLSCAGAFRSRDIQLWQVVFSPHGVKDGYTSIR